jgi:DNA topoisomerase-1
VLAARALQMIEPFTSKKAAKKNVVRAVEAVAKRLGNTVAVCRKCYIHPAILNSYLDGSLAKLLSRKASRELARHDLPQEEFAVLGVLQSGLSQESSGAKHRSSQMHPGQITARAKMDRAAAQLSRSKRGRTILRQFRRLTNSG